MTKEHILRDNLTDRYYEWLHWKGTRHEKDCLKELKNAITELRETL